MATPEKLNWWNRIFNRTTRTVSARGTSQWVRRYPNTQLFQIQGLAGQKIPNSQYTRNWVDYLVVDRLTGSETIEREYLD